MAKFRMDEMNDLNATGRRRLYPRMEITGQVDLRKLAREISIGRCGGYFAAEDCSICG